MRFVLCDDDQFLRSMVESIVARHGHDVVGCADGGVDATMLVESAKPDAVIVDFHLEDGVSGFDVIHLLRRLFNADLPAVMITGDDAVSDSDERMIQDIRCLSKPVGYSDLDGLIAEISVRIDPAQ